MTVRTCIALLRGINVGRSPRIPMAELRSLCESLGWQQAQTYVQSGNVVFRSAMRVSMLEKELERAISQAFGVTPSVIVRSAKEWSQYARTNPFLEESHDTPNLVMLALSKQPPDNDVLAVLKDRGVTERVERVDDALWIHFAGGAGRSRLTPAVLDRAMGSPTTTRNWRTVMAITELSGR